MSPFHHSPIHPTPVQAPALSPPTKHPAAASPNIAPPPHLPHRPATHRTTLRIGPINPAHPHPSAPRSRPKSAPPQPIRHSGVLSRNPVFAPRTPTPPRNTPRRLKSFLEKTLIAREAPVFASPPTPTRGPSTQRNHPSPVSYPRPAAFTVPPQKSAKSRAQRPRLPLRGSRGRWARVPHKARHEPLSPSHWPPAMPPPIMAALTRQGRDPCQSEPSTSVPGTEPAPTSAS